MPTQIQRVESLNKQNFEQSYLNKLKPVIISSGLEWKALEWTPEYFNSLFPGKIVNLDVNYSIPRDGKENLRGRVLEKISVEEALRLIYNNKDSKLKHYLAQRSIFIDFPELLQDVGVIPWINRDLRDKKNPANLWIGEAGNATPLHYDISHNFLTQLYGKKRIRLFAPSESKFLYCNTAEIEGPRYLSRISDIDNVDKEKYPLYRNASVYEGIISPGETIFIPSCWWHDVRSVDIAISINYWWQAKASETILPHLLPTNAYDLFETGRLRDVFNFISNPMDFKNDLEFSKYCKNNNHYFLSVLFMLNFFVTTIKSLAFFYNVPFGQKNTYECITELNQSMLNISEDFGVEQKVLLRWLEYGIETKKENNEMFDLKSLNQMESQIVDYFTAVSSNIKS